MAIEGKKVSNIDPITVNALKVKLGIENPKFALKNMVQLDFTYGATMALGQVTDCEPTTNTLYGHTVTDVLKSTDGWLTTESLYTTTGIRTVRLLKNNTLLVSTSGGKVYSSNTDKTVFSLVMAFPAGYTLEYSNVDIHDNIILLSTYGTKSSTNAPRFVVLSTDYGATWHGTIQKVVDSVTYNFIYEGLATEPDYHIHDACFDPYTGSIWILQGDSAPTMNYVYSHNYGETWHSFDAKRDTGIIATPDRLIIASDIDPHGIRQIMKDPAFPQKTDYSYAKNVEHVWTIDNYINWFIYRDLSHYPYDIICKGIGQPDGLNSYSKLFATPNGINWFVIWDIRSQFNTPGYAAGVTTISKTPDSNGWIYGQGVFVEGGNIQRFRMKLPEWVLLT